MGCTSRVPQHFEQTNAVVDLTDLYTTGHDKFMAALSADSLSQGIWEHYATRTVMVLIHIQYEDGEREQAQQTGLICGSGNEVLTAGHGFQLEDGKIHKIDILFPDGQTRQASLAQLQYEKDTSPRIDQATLAFKGPPFVLQERPMTLDEGALVMVMGYPAALGLNDQGQVVRVRERQGDSFQPLGLLCRQHPLNARTLLPLSGAIPTQGISGAPVISLSGELVGVFSSSGRQRSISGWHTVFWFSPLLSNPCQSSKGN